MSRTTVRPCRTGYQARREQARQVLFRLVLLAAAAVAPGCGGSDGRSSTPRFSGRWSFESGLEGWQARGLDLELGSGEIAWSIAPSTSRASDGSTSLELHLENENDAGKIFIQRVVELEPARDYDVALRFDLATQDWGDVNDFTILAGALAIPPASGKEIEAFDRGSTRSGLGGPTWVWLAKTASSHVRTGASGQVIIVLGIWGTWERAGTYYLDHVAVDIFEPG